MDNRDTAPTANRGSKYELQQSQSNRKLVDNQSDFDKMIQVLIDANLRQAQFIERMKGIRHG